MVEGGHGSQPSCTEWLEIAQDWSWSEREREVLRRLMAGQTRKQIARALSISVSTVRTHLRRALWKAGVPDLVSLLWCVVEKRDAMRHR